MNSKYCIGLMSGTSLDGVDLVYVKISNDNNNYHYELLAVDAVSYSSEWLAKLKAAFYYQDKALQTITIEYGKLLAEIITDFRTKHKIKHIDFIASHGHTIHHKPETGYTLQIGDGQTIATHTKCKTICDFRTQDVVLGGQGAPLVPIGDKLLFAHYDYCLNLGGFANISFDELGVRKAYDICPVNTVLNYYANTLGLPYDDGGRIAASGTVDNALLAALNKLPFYKSDSPKSLGFEFVEATVIPLIDSFQLTTETILATYVRHAALQIAHKIKQNGKILITGGGAYNTFLIDALKQLTSNKIIIPDNKTIDYKEALIFALLGYLKEFNQINCLKSVTGASKNHSSGVVFYP